MGRRPCSSSGTTLSWRPRKQGQTIDPRDPSHWEDPGARAPRRRSPSGLLFQVRTMGGLSLTPAATETPEEEFRLVTQACSLAACGSQTPCSQTASGQDLFSGPSWRSACGHDSFSSFLFVSFCSLFWFLCSLKHVGPERSQVATRSHLDGGWRFPPVWGGPVWVASLCFPWCPSPPAADEQAESGRGDKGRLSA